ncbi:unnamed protein product [Arabidopsis lyrata]|nr:unnamed protein product [Arabidopsis lyrata]
MRWVTTQTWWNPVVGMIGHGVVVASFSGGEEKRRSRPEVEKRRRGEGRERGEPYCIRSEMVALRSVEEEEEEEEEMEEDEGKRAIQVGVLYSRCFPGKKPVNLSKSGKDRTLENRSDAAYSGERGRFI